MKHQTSPASSPALRAVLCLAFAVSVQAFIALPSAVASTYVYDSVVSNWFTASENLPGFEKYVVKGVGSPSQTFYVADDLNQIMVKSSQGNFNGNAPGTYAGARWVAPEGERITSITFTYKSVLGPNLNLSIYIGEGNYDTKLDAISPGTVTGNRTNGDTVTWAIQEGVVATQFEFRNWDLIGTTGVDTGWSSAIVSVSITTVPYIPVPEPSTCAILAGAGILAATLWLRRFKAKP